MVILASAIFVPALNLNRVFPRLSKNNVVYTNSSGTSIEPLMNALPPAAITVTVPVIISPLDSDSVTVSLSNAS